MQRSLRQLCAACPAAWRTSWLLATGALLALSCSPQEESLPTGYGDGGGTAFITPDSPIVAGTTGHWTIHFVTGPLGVSPGGGVVIQFPVFWKWTSPQTVAAGAPGFVEVDCSNGGSILTAFASDLGWVRVGVAEEALAPGDTIRITYGGPGSEQVRVDPYAETGQEFVVKVDGDGDEQFAEIDKSPQLDILAAEAVQLRIFGKGEVKADEETVVTVAALDRFGNRAVKYTGTIRFAHRWSATGLPDSYQFVPEDRGARAFPIQFHEPGFVAIGVVEQGGTLQGISNPIHILPRGERPEFELLWGDLHQHSRLSDGTGIPEELYAYAREVENLDIMALTDHDHHGLRPLGAAEWDTIRAVNERYDTPDSFVTFLAYEWTNWVYGHRNVYFLDPEETLRSTADSATNSPLELWDALPEGEAITIAHHTGGGPVPTDWSIPPDPRFEMLVEISSVHGSSECRGCPKEIYNPVEGGFVRDALARGYRLGIIAAGDGHVGHPGETYALTGGLAGIWAGARTREAVWEAMLARRTYGTTGERIYLQVRLGRHWMGEEVPIAILPDHLEFEITAHGTEPIDVAELIMNGRVIANVHGDGKELEAILSADLPRVNAWAYVRITQLDGAMAWSSPIWITQ